MFWLKTTKFVKRKKIGISFKSKYIPTVEFFDGTWQLQKKIDIFSKILITLLGFEINIIFESLNISSSHKFRCWLIHILTCCDHGTAQFERHKIVGNLFNFLTETLKFFELLNKSVLTFQASALSAVAWDRPRCTPCNVIEYRSVHYDALYCN